MQDIVQAETGDGLFDQSINKEMAKEMYEREREERQRRKYLDDASDVSTESEIYEQGSTISESKQRHAAELDEEMDYDVERGYLISKAQFEQLRYHDEKILQLQKASVSGRTHKKSTKKKLKIKTKRALNNFLLL